MLEVGKEKDTANYIVAVCEVDPFVIRSARGQEKASFSPKIRRFLGMIRTSNQPSGITFKKMCVSDNVLQGFVMQTFPRALYPRPSVCLHVQPCMHDSGGPVYLYNIGYTSVRPILPRP